MAVGWPTAPHPRVPLAGLGRPARPHLVSAKKIFCALLTASDAASWLDRPIEKAVAV